MTLIKLYRYTANQVPQISFRKLEFQQRTIRLRFHFYMLFTRRTQPNLMEPEVAENVRQESIEKQKVQKLEYDKSAKNMKPLHAGDSVRYQHEKTWEPAIVVQQHHSQRSYIITTQTGQTLQRNRPHLLKTNETLSTPLQDTGTSFEKGSCHGLNIY